MAIKITTTKRQFATILAALRYYQNNPEIGNRETYVGKIATRDGKCPHMTADEIEDFCERLEKKFPELSEVAE